MKRILKSRRFWIAWMTLGLLLLGLVMLEQYNQHPPEEPWRAKSAAGTPA